MDTDLVLPIEVDAEGSLHRLFRQFFEDHFDQLVFIYRPPRKDPALKQATYRLALRDPIYCLTLIAQAHMANIKDQPANLSHFADEQTERIYSRLLRRTREKLEAFDVSDVDVLLLAIVALCEYDLQLGRHDALRSHHIGMTALVAKRGGPHNLGLSLPYVLRMDRFLAVRANQMPNFAPTELPTSDIVIRDAVRASGRGSYFVKDISGLSESTIVLCSDAAHLLDLTDELGIALKSASTTQSQSPKLEYYYYLRENIDARHAVLNSSSYENLATSPNEMLALTATKIVSYFVTSANYLPVVTDLLATRLWNILENASGSLSPASTMQNLDLEEGKTPRALSIKIAHWEKDTPMLLWLLFACALPSSSRERNMSFTAHLAMSEELHPASTAALSKSSHRQGAPRLESSGGRSIVSPSSPRRRRLLPNFILYVAEKLVGERPLSGTGEWDKEVVAILESFSQPTYTTGRRQERENGLTEPQIVYLTKNIDSSGQNDEQVQKLAEFYSSLRGGLLTYHGPGQLTAYLILKLRDHKLRPHQYVREVLEASVMRTCAKHGVPNATVTDNTGIWITEKRQHDGADTVEKDIRPGEKLADLKDVTSNRKICSIGVQITHTLTLYGIGLNIFDAPIDNKSPIASLYTLPKANPYTTDSVEVKENTSTGNGETAAVPVQAHATVPAPGYLSWGFGRVVACGLEGKTATWLTKEQETNHTTTSQPHAELLDSVASTFASVVADTLQLEGVDDITEEDIRFLRGTDWDQLRNSRGDRNRRSRPWDLQKDYSIRDPRKDFGLRLS
ncbi:hypothetical protein LTS08_002174 [Lithohypha guttulata]|nr:hypothetical protein LTS08_002174 [Lithohypha guttulata]